jgi:hypothetical protein
MKLEFPRQIFKNWPNQISNFMKIRLIGTKVFHMNGRTGGPTDRGRQTNITKLTDGFRDFANVPQKRMT